MKLKEAILKSLKELNDSVRPHVVTDHIIKNNYYRFNNSTTANNTVSVILILGNFIRENDPRVERSVPPNTTNYQYRYVAPIAKDMPSLDADVISRYKSLENYLQKVKVEIINKFVKVYNILQQLEIAVVSKETYRLKPEELDILEITDTHVTLHNNKTDSEYVKLTLSIELLNLKDDGLEQQISTIYNHNKLRHQNQESIKKLITEDLNKAKNDILRQFGNQLIELKDEIFIRASNTLKSILKSYTVTLLATRANNQVYKKDNFGFITNHDQVVIQVKYTLSPKAGVICNEIYLNHFKDVMKNLGIGQKEYHHDTEVPGFGKLPSITLDAEQSR